MTKRKRTIEDNGNHVPRRSKRNINIPNTPDMNNDDKNNDDNGVNSSPAGTNVASITQSARIASRSQRRKNQISSYSPEYHRSRTQRNKFVSPSQKVNEKVQGDLIAINLFKETNNEDACLVNDHVHECEKVCF